jgi:hypothetical protein
VVIDVDEYAFGIRVPVAVMHDPDVSFRIGGDFVPLGSQCACQDVAGIVARSKDVLAIGISDFGQRSLGDILCVDLPKVGQKLSAKAHFGDIESVKAVSELFAPISGEVIEVNGVGLRYELTGSGPPNDKSGCSSCPNSSPVAVETGSPTMPAKGKLIVLTTGLAVAFAVTNAEIRPEPLQPRSGMLSSVAPVARQLPVIVPCSDVPRGSRKART